MTVLFKKDNRGAMRQWEITAEFDGLKIVHGQVNGSMQEKFEEILEGKVNRSQEEQIELQINSRINRQVDKGYSYTIEEAESGTTNAMGLTKPMLAQPIKNVKNIDFKDAFIQAKYDGHRCLITKQDGQTIAYSRNGKPIGSVGHILAEIDLNEGETLDGELYIHGTPLQSISSLVRRNQEGSKDLRYHCYDIIADVCYRDRLAHLFRIANERSFIEVVPTKQIHSLDEAYKIFRSLRSRKYEGAIVRQGDFGYEDDKRSKSLIKIKECFDEEFYVVDIIPSKDGWARLELLNSLNGNTFMVSAPGNMIDKQEIMDNMNEYIGRWVTVEYSELTKDGIPFHPIATQWRDKNAE